MTETMDGGSVKIADDVVAVIASIAATDTEGVAGMSGGITEGITRYVSGKNAQKGVSVEVGQVEAAVDLRVIVYYGAKIDEVCRQIQLNVKESIENMTGLKVVEVNVKVEGVQFRKDEEEVQVEEEPKVR